MAQSVLAIVAHPDDIEFLMSGTMMRFRAAGYELHYMNVSSGNLGSETLAEDEIRSVRVDESKAAALMLGAVWHPPFLHDLEIIYEVHALRQLASIVREIQPSVILTHSLEDYMEDHTATARLAVTAAFSRGMKNFVTIPMRESYRSDVAVYHAQPHMNRDALGRWVHPRLVVDVSDLMDMRRQALSMHRSQKDWLDASQGMDSYIQTMVDNSAELGRLSGRYAYAEGWRPHYHIGFCSAGFRPMEEDLASHIVEIPFEG